MSTKKIQILNSIMKQAENADTLDGKHADEFALATDLSTLQTQVGDKSVSEQIDEAIGNSNAVLYTEQTLTNEQRKQARANISKYKWHTTKAGQINIILADHAPYISPTSTFDIELADQITSVSDPNDTCLGALAFYAKFSCPIIENINATRLEKMFIEFDALKDAGVLSSNSMYIAFKGVEEDTPILCVQLSTSSETGFTHFYQVLSGNSYTATRGTVYWNKDTKTFENHITMNYSDDTLTKSKYAVAKTVGDALALKADQTALDEVNTLIGDTNVSTQISNYAAPISHASSDTIYGVSSESNYGHAKASDTTPKANGIADAGSETSSFARGDHIHPLQTDISGNAGTATKATQDSDGNQINETYVKKSGSSMVDLNALTFEMPSSDEAITPTTNAIASSPFTKDMYIDVFAFLDKFKVQDWQSMNSTSSTWSNLTGNTIYSLFHQRESGSGTIVLSSSKKAYRFTLYGDALRSKGFIDWIVLRFHGTYKGTYEVCVEYSDDGEAWTEFHRSTERSTALLDKTNFIVGPSTTLYKYLRFTFTIVNYTSGNLYLDSVRGYTAYESTVINKPLEYPYDWNYSRDIYPHTDNERSLGISNKRWQNVYATTFNGDVVLSDNTNVGTELSNLNNKWAGCWISFTDENGNATTEPYIHWEE